MEFIIKNWYIILLLIVFLFLGYASIIRFIDKPTEMKIESLKKWLRMAVVLAEKKYGSNTCQLKLMEVYSRAVQELPWIVSLIDFNDFSRYVDEALEWMNKQIDNNKSIEAIVKNKE